MWSASKPRPEKQPAWLASLFPFWGASADPLERNQPEATGLVGLAREAAFLRDLVGNPFQPLPARTFPGHVVELARECYAAFPAVSDRFLILADALADLSEDNAADHCRQGEHVKGCHVLDWVLGKE